MPALIARPALAPIRRPCAAPPSLRSRGSVIRPAATGGAHHQASNNATASQSVTLPVDFYSFLQGVGPTSSREAILSAYDRALNNPPAVGYSQRALLARATVLKGALDTLLDPTARRAYDEELRAGGAGDEVPFEYVPGVLSLLQESGQAHVVIAAGEAWLSTNRRHPAAADVAVAVALAHADMATLALQRTGDAGQSTRMLEVALGLLREYRAGASLRRELNTAIKELSPRLALELLSASPAGSPQRARGLRLVRLLLSAPAWPTPRGLSRQAFLERLPELLSAAEQVELYQGCGAAYASSAAGLYHAALAHVAVGCATRQPALLSRALDLLQRAGAEEAAAEVEPGRRATEGRVRRAVASAACLLLLGDPDGAERSLGLRGSPDGKPVDRQIHSFVWNHSPSADDLLPGLCVLTQRWAQDVALSSFSDTRGAAFSLEAWFDDEAVQKQVRALQSSGAVRAQALGALRTLSRALSAPAVGLVSGVLSLLGLLSRGEAENQAHAGNEAAEAPPAGPVAAAAARFGGGQVDIRETRRARQLQPAAPPPPTATYGLEPVVEAKPEAPMRFAPEAATAFQQASQRATEGAAGAYVMPEADASLEEVLEAAEAGLFEDSSDGADPTPVPVERIQLLREEAQMWRDLEAARRARWARALAALALAAGGVAAVAVAGIRPLSQQGAAATAARVTLAPTAGAELSRRDAERVIARWQKVKAEALGPQHSVAPLEAVLHGGLLQQWTQRAEELRAKGWYYTHALERSAIDSFASDVSSGTGVVRASLAETVRVHKGDGSAPQSFRSEYSVQYQVARLGDAWVITQAEVLA